MDSNSKSVTSLFIVLALLALLALAVSVSKQDDADEQKIFAPQLSAGLNDITAIRVLTGGDNLVADIRRNNDAWLVHNADNYPAKVGALRELLLTLSEAEIVEATTAIEANYARLGVRDISMAEAAGVEIEIDGLSESFAIILGNSSSGNTNFARLTGQEQSWRITGTHSPVRITLDWLDRTLMNFSANDVLSIEIVHGDEETVLVNKAAAGFELAGLTDSEKSLASVLNNLAGALSNLKFDAVMPASDLPDNNLTRITVRTINGISVNVAATKVEEDIWFTFAVIFDPESTTIAPSNDENAAVENTPPAKASSTSTAQVKSEQLSKRLTGWAYKIPTFKSDWLLKRKADLLTQSDT